MTATAGKPTSKRRKFNLTGGAADVLNELTGVTAPESPPPDAPAPTEPPALPGAEVLPRQVDEDVEAMAPPSREVSPPSPSPSGRRDISQFAGGPLPVPPVSADPADAPRDAFVEKMASGVVPTLEDCERHITKVTTQWLLAVGYALKAIKDHELFREKGYTSFTAYVRAEHPWDPTYVSRVIADIPVVEALAEHGVDRDLNEGQATAMRPVFEEHGREALFDVWDSTTGKRSAAALVRTARAKGYLPPEPETTTKAQAEPAGVLPVLRPFKEFAALISSGNGRRLIEAAKADPDWARGRLLPALKDAVWTLESEFGPAEESDANPT